MVAMCRAVAMVAPNCPTRRARLVSISISDCTHKRAPLSMHSYRQLPRQRVRSLQHGAIIGSDSRTRGTRGWCQAPPHPRCMRPPRVQQL